MDRNHNYHTSIGYSGFKDDSLAKKCAYHRCNNSLTHIEKGIGKCKCRKIYCSIHMYPKQHMCENNSYYIISNSN